MSKVLFALICVLALSFVGLSDFGSAPADAASATTKKRKASMNQSADALRFIADMAREKTEFNKKRASAAARRVQSNAKKIPGLFPKGSLESDSRATPLIWQDFKGFSARARLLQRRADAMVKAIDNAESVEDIKQPLSSTGSTCRGCHAKYRAQAK